MADSEKTVAVTFTVKAQEALSEIDKIIKQTKEVRKQMEELSKTSTASYSQLAKAMVRTRETEVKTAISGLGKYEETSGKKTYSEEDKAKIAELKKSLAEYKAAVLASQREIEASQKQSNSNMLKGQREYSSAVIALKKEEATALLEQAKKQREIDRQGLYGSELATKAKEQADAAVEAYQRANEAYKQQIETRKTLSAQLMQTNDTATAKELENAKKREEALKIESNMLKQNANTATAEYKKIADASSQTNQLTSSITALGKVAGYVFGTIFGITAIGTLRSFVRSLGEAGQRAIEYTKILFTLGLAVRQMQRKGDETTSIGVLKEEIASFRKEFDFFSQMEVTKAFAEATNKLANLGYTAEQVANVVRIGMIVYTTDLTGRFNDLGEAINGVTNYLASGYGESLERSGFISGRAGDKIAAYELGLGKTLATLDPLTLSQTRYNLILGQAAEKAADASSYIETLSGQYKSASADIVDANVEIGKSVDDLIVKWQQAKAAALGFIAASLASGNVRPEFDLQIEKLAKGYNTASKLLEEYTQKRKDADKYGASPEVIKYYDDQIEKLSETKQAAEDLFMEFTYAPARTEEGLSQLRDQLDRIFLDIEERGAGTVLELNGIQMSQDTQTRDIAALQNYLDTLTAGVTAIVTPKVEPEEDKTKILKYKTDLETILKEAEDIQNDYTKKTTDLWNDYVNKVGTSTDSILGDIRQLMNYDGTVVEVKVVGSIETDFQQKMADIQRDFEEKASQNSARLGKIEQDYADKVADAQRNYATQLAQSIRQYNIRRAELERKYRLNELQAERKFQEEMRKLREGFLMDLEGALRERDALQVIRLTREYNLQKEQRTRQFEDEKKTRKENYEEEKKQLAIEQAERQRQLAEELANRLASIKAEKEAERAQAEEDRKKAEAEARAERDQAIADANAQLEEGRRQAEIERTGRLEAFRQSLIDQGVVTKEFLDQFGLDLESYFGKGQKYDKILGFFQSTIQNTTDELGVLAEELSKTMGSILGVSSKAASMPVPGFSGLETPPIVGEPTTAATAQPIELPIEITVDEAKVQEATTAALEEANTVIQSTIDSSTSMGVEPISLPVIVSNENILEETKAALAEANAMRIEGLSDIKEQNDAEQTELEAQYIERIKSFRTMLEDEGTLTQDALKQLIAVLNTYFGQGRPFDFIMTWFENRTALAGAKVIAIFTAIMTALKALMSLGKTGEQIAAQIPKAGSSTSSSKAMYSGGILVATKPTEIVFGEYEPEYVEFTPLSKLSRSKAQDIADNPQASKTARILAISKLSNVKTNAEELPTDKKKMATGGSMVVNSPTTFEYGDQGTEFVEYKSLSSITNTQSPKTSSSFSGSKKTDSKNSIYLSVGLDQGLIASVTDTVLDEAAEVFLDVMRNNQ